MTKINDYIHFIFQCCLMRHCLTAPLCLVCQHLSLQQKTRVSLVLSVARFCIVRNTSRLTCDTTPVNVHLCVQCVGKTSLTKVIIESTCSHTNSNRWMQKKEINRNEKKNSINKWVFYWTLLAVTLHTVLTWKPLLACMLTTQWLIVL